MILEATLSRARLPVLAGLGVMAAGLAAGPPGSWQYWGGHPYYGGAYRNYRQNPQRDFFFPFSGFMRPPPVADSTKAPATRKLEAPPTTTVVVVGDSTADWLGYGLDELYADQPEIGVERKIRTSSGLVRYDAKNETLHWPRAHKNALANEKPDAIVVMLGINDPRAPRRKN